MKKRKQFFDEKAYDKFCNGLLATAQRFFDAVTALRKEGIDVSVKELSTYPERFSDLTSGDGWTYTRHFNQMYEDAVKRAGWLPKEEKERMRRNFMDVCSRTKAAAQVIANTIGCGYVLDDSPEGTAIDVDATMDAKRPDFMYDVDADAMAEHWAMLRDIRDKVTALNKFNLAHGIPTMGAPGPYDYGGFAAYALNLNDINGDMIKMSEEQHNEITWQYFKVRK